MDVLQASESGLGLLGRELAGFDRMVESAADFIAGFAQRGRQDVLQDRAIARERRGMSDAAAHHAGPDDGNRLNCGHQSPRSRASIILT